MALWSAISQLLFTQIFGVWWLLKFSGSKFYLPVMPLRIWSSAQYSEILRPSQFNFSCLFLLSLFYRLQSNIVELFPFLKTLLCWFPHVFVLTSFFFSALCYFFCISLKSVLWRFPLSVFELLFVLGTCLILCSVFECFIPLFSKIDFCPNDWHQHFELLLCRYCIKLYLKQKASV